ncbi:MAG: hypothetical protein GWO12_16970 [Gemmatimonadetes bacterium]|uniref:Terminase n=1 Tax=Candidatus Kutchimonas denitrificans TaxID=3056748 RepID=A0AAE5CAQ6_9BACT|nr:hypothetical protein [Candidatus Kutchimonas denitrificans]
MQNNGKCRLYILKARQGGVTTYEQARNLHTIWANPGAAVMTLAHTREDTDKIFRITQRAVNNFPQALLPTLGGRQTREIGFPGMDSTFWTATAGAKRVGRSVTLSRLHGSEFAFWDEPTDTLNQLSPALEKPNTSIVLETTASAHGSTAHEFWEKAESGESGYEALFLPWWICDHELYRSPLEHEDEISTLSEEEQILVDNHGLDLEQIKWRREKIAEKGRAEFLQEYAEDPESCWLTAGDLFFDGNVLKYLQESAPEPKRREPVHLKGWNGMILVYGEQVGFDWEKERVVIGVDVAEGGGGDRSAWVARSFPSWELLETFADSSITPKQLAEILNARGRKHDNALLVIEKNGHGITVLRELRDEHRYPLAKLYHRTQVDRAANKQTLAMGWTTTAQSKPLMLDAGRELITSAKNGEVAPPGIDAIRDAFNTVRDKNGKVDLNGRDMLVAEMLAWLGRDYAVGGYKSFTAPV